MKNNTSENCEFQDDLKPDLAEARRQLETLFGDVEKEYPGGVIEIRAIDPTEKLNPVCLFYDCTKAGIVEAIEASCRLNSQRRNIYAGLNPRKPGTSGSGTNDDIEIAFAVWVDLDSEVSHKIFSAGCPLPPSFVIRTGSVPHPRRQLFWVLDTPVRNLAQWSQLMKGAYSFFKGDQISDPARLVRVAGFISWPSAKKKKRGYEDELVRVEATDES
jgi:hypothetical protein